MVTADAPQPHPGGVIVSRPACENCSKPLGARARRFCSRTCCLRHVQRYRQHAKPSTTEPNLTRQEALILRELTRGPASTYLLADALGITNDWPAAKFRIHATVSRVRAKFGANVIQTMPGGGYRLGGAL